MMMMMKVWWWLMLCIPSPYSSWHEFSYEVHNLCGYSCCSHYPVVATERSDDDDDDDDDDDADSCGSEEEKSLLLLLLLEAYGEETPPSITIVSVVIMLVACDCDPWASEGSFTISTSGSHVLQVVCWNALSSSSSDVSQYMMAQSVGW